MQNLQKRKNSTYIFSLQMYYSFILLYILYFPQQTDSSNKFEVTYLDTKWY